MHFDCHSHMLSNCNDMYFVMALLLHAENKITPLHQ